MRPLLELRNAERFLEDAVGDRRSRIILGKVIADCWTKTRTSEIDSFETSCALFAAKAMMRGRRQVKAQRSSRLRGTVSEESRMFSWGTV